MELQVLKDELSRLKNNTDFMKEWDKIMYSALDLYLKAVWQENLIATHSNLFTILNIQRVSNKSNLINGDLYIPDYDLYVDLKVSTRTTDNELCGVVNESSVLGFREDGWYLCINKSFTKFAFFPHSVLVDRYNNNGLKLLEGFSGKFVPSYQYENFTTIIDI